MNEVSHQLNNPETVNTHFAKRYNQIHNTLEAIPGRRISLWEKGEYLYHTLWQLRHLQGIESSQRARVRGRRLALQSMKALRDLGITVSFHGDERFARASNMRELFPDDVALTVGNHTASGIEALYAYAMLPLRTRIILKEELTQVPFGIGDGFSALDPITVPPEGAGSRAPALKQALSAIGGKDPNNSLVHIYPEGERSLNGEILPFDDGIQTMIVFAQKVGRRRIGIITTDAHAILPNRTEDMFVPGKSVPAYKGEIRFYIDLIDVPAVPKVPTADGLDTIDKVAQKRQTDAVITQIRAVMERRLDESLTTREKELGIL